ncbi:hypothetical protein ACFL1D_04255 [Candidatus Omnitrophota bacterium]
MNRRGSILIVSYMVITVLTILTVGFIARSVTESNIFRRYANSVDSFWLAEAGIARALNELRDDFSVSGEDLWPQTLIQGDYYVDVEVVGQMRKVTSYGSAPGADSLRVIEAMIEAGTPTNFYDHAVYSGGDIDFNGSAYSVDGDVLYADDFDVQEPGNINGDVVEDASASPLARFNFDELLAISAAQGNVYDASRLDDVKNGADNFPLSFWYEAPTVPGDPTTGTPNVVYVLTDLQLNGNIGTIGGLYVVVGDVVTNPDSIEDLTINGNGEIDGIVYTRGEFRVNGGAGGLNVSGGVWAGEEARLNGNAHLAFNQDYMDSVEALDINIDPQIVWWRDTQSPYKISP